MTLDLSKKFTLVVDITELRLIEKALGGRLDAEEVSIAKKLGDSIAVAKAAQILHLSKENDKLIANLKKSGVWEE